MEKNAIINPKMTRLEELLKYCMKQRPEIMEHIPTSEEFMDYIQWMIREFGDNPEFKISDSARLGPIFNLSGNKISSIGGRLISDPHDAQALRQISEGYDMYREDMFISSEQDITAARMMRYLPSQWHANDHFEVYYCFSGDCAIHFTTETVRAKPGAVLIVAPGVVHASPCFSDDCTLLIYTIRASTFDRVFWNQIPPENLMASFFRQALSGVQPNAYLQFDTGEDADIRDFLFRIYAESVNSESYKSQMMNALMSAFFVLILRRYEGTVRLPRTDSFFWKHEYSAILSYIQSHFATVKLPELAESFHYSEKQIRRIIQGTTGMSYTELITKLRMEQAAALLRRSNIPMDEIAHTVGYSTVNSLYRVFTDYYGCTPGNYVERSDGKEKSHAGQRDND